MVKGGRKILQTFDLYEVVRDFDVVALPRPPSPSPLVILTETLRSADAYTKYAGDAWQQLHGYGGKISEPVTASHRLTCL